MRKLLLKSLLTIACLLCSITASAYDFESEGIYYNITSKEGLTVAVTHNGDSYSGTSYTGSVTIPSQVISGGNSYSVTSIGKNAFYSCGSLTSVTIPDNVTTIGEYAFYRCSGLTSLTIPDNVTTIARSTFCGCIGLTSLTIPDNVTTIAEGAFNGCRGLTSITIPDKVTSISFSAFGFCRGLTLVNIPKSLTNIGSGAFQYCTSLKEIRNYSEQPQSISTGSQFNSVDVDACTLYVPTGSLSAYKAAEGWADFSNIMELGSGISATSADGVKIAVTGSEITISGVSGNATVDVYSMAGQHVYSGTDKTITVPGVGAYIVKVAGVTKKVVM